MAEVHNSDYNVTAMQHAVSNAQRQLSNGANDMLAKMRRVGEDWQDINYEKVAQAMNYHFSEIDKALDYLHRMSIALSKMETAISNYRINFS